MKLCKDCKYFYESTDFVYSYPNNIKYGKCSYKEQNELYDPVTGEKKEPYMYASVQRSFPNFLAFIARECGKTGRYFEPKE